MKTWYIKNASLALALWSSACAPSDKTLDKRQSKLKDINGIDNSDSTVDKEEKEEEPNPGNGKANG